MPTVDAAQRYTKERPCPVCGGYDKTDRGRGVRCFGYLAGDGQWANCTREDKAGVIKFNPKSATYGHKMQGKCGCGVKHGPNPHQDRLELEVTYDYRDADGQLLFQVLRYRSAAGKTFKQRRPKGNGDWVWNLANVPRVLYRLPDLMKAGPDEPVFVVEGEKDVDRLQALGAVATTNPGGTLKWRKEYSEILRDRHVVIIPDNDPPNLKKPPEHLKGQKHAAMVARTLYDLAASVRVLELPELGPKGDVSDWLDGGGTLDHLFALAAVSPTRTSADPYKVSPNGLDGPEDLVDEEEEGEFWGTGSKYKEPATKLVKEGLLANGFFINADSRFYYFDEPSKTVYELDSSEMNYLLNETYGINSTETFSKFLVQEMKNECYQRGRPAKISVFASYDPDANLLFMDLGHGRALKLDGKTIEEVTNGTNGVLFIKSDYSTPWNFIPDQRKGPIGDILIHPMNFVIDEEESPHTTSEQKLLLFAWMLAIPFESIQPTKSMALALGPQASGKSSLFRRIGRMLYGPSFQVDGLRKEGEDDFWVATTNNPFVAFDNVDRYIPWLEDALAKCTTGIRITKRALYENNRQVSYTPRAFIALTARTPQFRRDDVASRTIPFRLASLENESIRPEHEMLVEIEQNRDQLMSEYILWLNDIVATTVYPPPDAGLRLSDFANVVSRIGAALGVSERIEVILKKLRTSQHMYSIEEDNLILALQTWIDESSKAGTLALETPNSDREVDTRALFEELKGIAERDGLRLRLDNHIQMGKQLKALEAALKLDYNVVHRRNNRHKWWKFSRKEESKNGATSSV